MTRPLELTADHLQSIDSISSLDLKLLAAGLADASERIKSLEQSMASAVLAPKLGPYERGS